MLVTEIYDKNPKFGEESGFRCKIGILANNLNFYFKNRILPE